MAVPRGLCHTGCVCGGESSAEVLLPSCCPQWKAANDQSGYIIKPKSTGLTHQGNAGGSGPYFILTQLLCLDVGELRAWGRHRFREVRPLATTSKLWTGLQDLYSKPFTCPLIPAPCCQGVPSVSLSITAGREGEGGLELPSGRI